MIGRIARKSLREVRKHEAYDFTTWLDGSMHAEIGIGYHCDTFLNAMDTGIDAAKKSELIFNGSYAIIATGLRD